MRAVEQERLGPRPSKWLDFREAVGHSIGERRFWFLLSPYKRNSRACEKESTKSRFFLRVKSCAGE
jgi:hypothetical protein